MHTEVLGKRRINTAMTTLRITPRTSPQAVPEFQCLQRILLPRTASKRAKGTRRGVLGQRTKGTAMAMLWNITMPTRAPAAELASPQALPGFDFKRFRKPSVKPSLGLNVKREIHIDFGWTESTRNALGNDRLKIPRLRILNMATRMISMSVTGMI